MMQSCSSVISTVLAKMTRALLCWRIQVMLATVWLALSRMQMVTWLSLITMWKPRAGSHAWRLSNASCLDLGHLSNEDGADAMIRTLGNRTKKIYLDIYQREHRWASPHDHGQSVSYSGVECCLRYISRWLQHHWQTYKKEAQMLLLLYIFTIQQILWFLSWHEESQRTLISPFSTWTKPGTVGISIAWTEILQCI